MNSKGNYKIARRINMDDKEKIQILVFRVTKESDITPEMISYFSSLNQVRDEEHDPRELRNYFLDNCKGEDK